jgi:D-alanyl-D-alanine carboxypeptidase
MRRFLGSLMLLAATDVAAQDLALSVRLDSAIRNHHDGGAGASIAVAIMRGRDTLLLRAYGLADRDAGRRATPHTVYEIGSLTKQITAAAVMKLVEEGKLDLDADIDRYLPDSPLRGRHIAVRNLLNHTSGIHNYTNDQEWKKHWSEDLTPADVVNFVARDSLDFRPGTKNAYSNTGYTVLGMIIENVSGKPYATFVEEQLFGPLGLRSTRYCASHPSDTLVAKGYTTRNRQPARAEYLSMTIPYAAGAICSSVADFIQWERAFHAGRVVNATSYKRMMTPDTLANGTRLNYGFGMTIGLLGGHPAAMHGGEVNGFASAQIYLPRDSVGVVVFTNDQSATPQIIALDLARLVLGVPATGRGALDRPAP